MRQQPPCLCTENISLRLLHQPFSEIQPEAVRVDRNPAFRNVGAGIRREKSSQRNLLLEFITKQFFISYFDPQKASEDGCVEMALRDDAIVNENSRRANFARHQQ